jgi:hypothetical protein
VLSSLLLAIVLAVTSPEAAAADMVAGPVGENLDPPVPIDPPGWIVETGNDVDVHGRAEQDRLLIQLARHANKTVPAFAETLGVPVGGRITLYVADTDAEFHAMQPGRTPEWADGTAWPRLGAVFLRSPLARPDGAEGLLHVLDHELTHVLLGRAFAPNEPPHWLQEGLARDLAGEQGPQDAEIIAQGVVSGGLFTLENLHASWPRDANGARLAYAQSADFVAFLRGEHGDEALRTLIRELSGGASIDAAIYRATGETLGALDDRWRARFSGGSVWLSGAGSLVTFVFCVGVVGALFRRRLQTRERMRRMREAEAARDAAMHAAALHGRDGYVN